jgi:hypothetical protein
MPPTATPIPSPTPEPGLKFETTVVANVGSDYTTVNLQNVYLSLVVVCTVNYADNAVPVVTPLNNVNPSAFDVRLQNPVDGAPVTPETVHCFVVEEGAWTLPDGRNIEARTYLSTITDENSSWVGEG